MPGDGTKLATTTNSPPPARLLDITRLIRRAGRTPTGVDRVVSAYLHHLADGPAPLFALARTPMGYVLLGPQGVDGIAARAAGHVPWGRADTLARWLGDRSEVPRRAESDLRRLALDRCLPPGLPKMLSRHLPPGFAYLNVGHSNLTDRVLSAVRHGANGRVAVLIHDVIPLDFPQYQRPGTAETFRAMLKRVRAHAHVIIFNSAHTRRRAEAWMRRWGPVPDALVAHLGVPVPQPGRLPGGFDPARPWFVVVGTIEPRKGHDLLLDIWEDMQCDHGRETPQLLICGARGWMNDAVFARLNRLPPDSPVHEMPGLSDGQVAALIKGARALLLPSRAEGFGLPPVEAAALGTPVICSDLPAIREVLGDIPVYVSETDRYQFRKEIEAMLGQGRRPERAVEAFVPPAWADHFDAVLKVT